MLLPLTSHHGEGLTLMHAILSGRWRSAEWACTPGLRQRPRSSSSALTESTAGRQPAGKHAWCQLSAGTWRQWQQALPLVSAAACVRNKPAQGVLLVYTRQPSALAFMLVMRPREVMREVSVAEIPLSAYLPWLAVTAYSVSRGGFMPLANIAYALAVGAEHDDACAPGHSRAYAGEKALHQHVTGTTAA